MISHQAQDTSAPACSSAPQTVPQEHGHDTPRPDTPAEKAHSLNQPLLRQYLQGMCDDPRLAKASSRYVPLQVGTEAGDQKDAVEATRELAKSVKDYFVELF